MSVPIRVSDKLLKQAEKQMKMSYRSLPKQIEFWALIGKEIENLLTPADVAALLNGEIEIQIHRKKSTQVNFDNVFHGVEKEREAGTLSRKTIRSNIWYEESHDHPGLLVRVTNGRRELGNFNNGRFETIKVKI